LLNDRMIDANSSGPLALTATTNQRHPSLTHDM